MATSSDVLCSICEAQHAIRNADNWCPECEEGLCSECLNHHSVSKCTKSHEVISIENYHKLPQSVSKIVQHCTAPVRNVSIHDINLVLLQKKERLYNTIRGCAITPNGKFLFADYGTKGLHILNEDWTTDNLDVELPAISKAFDVTCINDTRLAISTGRFQQIIILNIASKKIEKIINTSHECYGITQNEGSLLFCERTKGISRVQLSNNSISLLVKQEGCHSYTYVITSEDNIYHTNEKNNTISCHKINGDKLWEFQDVAIIREPNGVALDRDLNVYVASRGNNSVVVISPDGKRCRTVLDESDGIAYPMAICFDKVKYNLVVCNLDGTALLYKVE